MGIYVTTGRLGRDCELKTTQKGTQICSFSLAEDRRKGGEKHTVWIKCMVSGDRAAKVAPFLTKGSVVEVSGEINSEHWVKNGEAHSALSVWVNGLTFHGGGRKDDGPVADKAKAMAGQGPAHLDDDIPFAPEWR